MKKVIFTLLIVFTLVFVSCNSEKNYVVDSPNFFNITNSGEVSLTSDGFTSIEKLKEQFFIGIPVSIHSDVTVTLNVPDKISGKKVLGIDKSGFARLVCDGISLPSSIVKIGDGAFNNASVPLKNLPKSLKIIEDGAFYNLMSSVTVEIPEAVEQIGQAAFYDVKSVSINENNPNFKIEDNFILSSDGTVAVGFFGKRYYFNGNSFTIPNTVTVIGKGCYIHGKTVTIPVSVTEIKYGAFLDVDNLIYEGTVEEFNNIVKENDWSFFVGEVTCSDGKVSVTPLRRDPFDEKYYRHLPD